MLSGTNHDPTVKETLLVDASNRFFTVIPSIHPHVIKDEDDFKLKVRPLYLISMLFNLATTLPAVLCHFGFLRIATKLNFFNQLPCLLAIVMFPLNGGGLNLSLDFSIFFFFGNHLLAV